MYLRRSTICDPAIPVLNETHSEETLLFCEFLNKSTYQLPNGNSLRVQQEMDKDNVVDVQNGFSGISSVREKDD